jgi:chromate transport protein ChrA
METTTATTDNAGNGNRIDQFKTEVTDLNLKTGSASRERSAMIFGLLLMIVGIVAAFLLYVSSQNTSDPRDLQSQLIFAVAFLTLTVAGAALFLRYSLAAFLRMWLLRQLYEGQANTDRLVEAITDRG